MNSSIEAVAKPQLSSVQFSNQVDSGFRQVVKTRVHQYFQTRGLSKHCNWLMISKSAFYVTGWLSLYVCILSGRFSEPVMLGMCALLGFFLTGIGFNIGHDAVHNAYASNPKMNRLIAFSFEFIGANTYTWRIRHNLIHHSFTNIQGADGDLESMPLLRFCLKPGRKWYHRFQHWYVHILYCFVTLVWVFKKDYMHMLEESREQRLNKKPRAGDYALLIAGKLFHYFVFLILPPLVLHIAFWKVAIGFLTMHFVAGYVMASVFQLGHIVEGPEFMKAPEEGVIEASFVEHQLKTTSNFGEHFLTTWICGGLNYQIEHHIFPTICHIHYPAISKIVRKTAAEFSLPYYSQSNIFLAIRSHLRMLKYFGTTDPA